MACTRRRQTDMHQKSKKKKNFVGSRSLDNQTSFLLAATTRGGKKNVIDDDRGAVVRL